MNNPAILGYDNKLPYFWRYGVMVSRSVTSDLMGVITPTIAAIRINHPLSGHNRRIYVGNERCGFESRRRHFLPP